MNIDALSAMILGNFTLREVEQDIYSVLPDNTYGNEYDSQFGFIYDLVACNPIYNRLIWGYSVKIFSEVIKEALNSSQEGPVLDIACGSLAFTAKTYSQFTQRPVILADQSLKMLRMAKAKLLELEGNISENLVFLHTDALQLPFQETIFSTIVSENLLHCLKDTSILLRQLKSASSKNGRIYFTTLVKANRIADKYLAVLAGSDKLVSREVADHETTFEHAGLSAKYETIGNLLVIKAKKIISEPAP